MAIGETGTLKTGISGRDHTIRVDFTEPMPDAVIHLTSSNAGGNEFSLRVVSVDEKGFEFQLEEFENHDGSHTTEQFNWIAVKPGIHKLPDGRIIEAGHTKASTETSEVALGGSYDAPPVILTNVMSEYGKDTVDSDPFDVSTKGFSLRLQEGSLVDGINTGEAVGFIAISQGGDGSFGVAQVEGGLSTARTDFALDATTENGLVFGETQSMNDTSAGNVHLQRDAAGDQDKVSLVFDEETGDRNSAHALEDVGIVVFGTGMIPCFTPGTLIDTAQGPRNVESLTPGTALRTRDNGLQLLRWHARVVLSRADLRAAPHLHPVRIRAHAFGPGAPARDLCVSPQHRVLITGYRAQLLFGASEVLAPACGLVNGHSVQRMPSADTTYIHLLCDSHQVLRSDGLWSESLLARDLALSHSAPRDREALFEVFGDLRAMGRAEERASRRCLTHTETRALVCV